MDFLQYTLDLGKFAALRLLLVIGFSTVVFGGWLVCVPSHSCMHPSIDWSSST